MKINTRRPLPNNVITCFLNYFTRVCRACLGEDSPRVDACARVCRCLIQCSSRRFSPLCASILSSTAHGKVGWVVDHQRFWDYMCSVSFSVAFTQSFDTKNNLYQKITDN
jgi:hypothetical protein